MRRSLKIDVEKFGPDHPGERGESAWVLTFTDSNGNHWDGRAEFYAAKEAVAFAKKAAKHAIEEQGFDTVSVYKNSRIEEVYDGRD